LSVVFSSDGKRIASASTDKTLKLWDAMTGRELATLNGHEDTVYCCCFSPDGSQIVSASEDQTVKLWDAATGRELATLGNDDRVLACAFSPDARRIISNGVVLSVWDVQQRRLLARLEALSEMKSLSALVEGPGRYRRLPELLQGRSESFAISADARFIAWASWDRRLILSNGEAGRTVGEFYLRGRGTAVGWSPVAGIIAGTEAGAVYLLRPEGFSFDPAIATESESAERRDHSGIGAKN
jgi:WD40 repeat protein